MNGIFELLERKDRRILGVLCLFLILALIYLFVVALGAKRSYEESLDQLAAKKESALKMEDMRKEKNAEWLKWNKTLQDVEELRDKYFYKDKEGISPLMRDMQQILNSARIRVSQKRYDYADLEEGLYRIVHVTFETAGSYAALKKFIHSVETFPRFLVVQKLDFMDVDPLSGGLKVKVALVAYYEQ
jgi:Tfp pilus assembly protein PilO